MKDDQWMSNIIIVWEFYVIAGFWGIIDLVIEQLEREKLWRFIDLVIEQLEREVMKIYRFSYRTARDLDTFKI